MKRVGTSQTPTEVGTVALLAMPFSAVKPPLFLNAINFHIFMHRGD